MQVSALEVWRMLEKDLSKLLERGIFHPLTMNVYFYAPSFMFFKTKYFCSSPEKFPTISVTGKGCVIKCKHCGGKVLKTMHPATTPEKLYSLCLKLRMEGARGCLISGGCRLNGSVPLENFVPAIEKVKKNLGMTVFTHVGNVNLETAKKLKGAGVDAALIDVIGSDETIREIYKLNLTVKDYESSLKSLFKTGLNFVPHVIVGLHYGKLKGELNALEMIAKYEPKALVIIAFMPIRGTEMEGVEPPKPLEIARVLAAARLMFPGKPIALGCMRPKVKHRVETDVLAVKAGVDAIAFPSEEAVKFAEEKGYKTYFSPLCCSQVYMDISK